MSLSGKKGIFNGENAKAFNKVVLDYALPAALFVSIVDASREMLVQDIKLSLISLIVMMFCFMLVYYVYKWCFKKNTGADAAIMALISGSSTIGFLGFAVPPWRRPIPRPPERNARRHGPRCFTPSPSRWRGRLSWR